VFFEVGKKGGDSNFEVKCSNFNYRKNIRNYYQVNISNDKGKLFEKNCVLNCWS